MSIQEHLKTQCNLLVLAEIYFRSLRFKILICETFSSDSRPKDSLITYACIKLYTNIHLV